MKPEQIDRLKSLDARHWYLGDFEATCEAVATLLREREQLLGALRAVVEAHCTEQDESARGCHCFYAVEHATAREAIAAAES